MGVGCTAATQLRIARSADGQRVVTHHHRWSRSTGGKPILFDDHQDDHQWCSMCNPPVMWALLACVGYSGRHQGRAGPTIRVRPPSFHALKTAVSHVIAASSPARV